MDFTGFTDFIDYKMDQEILLEQIVSYTIGASEMIPNIANKAQQDYQLAILPHGPHFYTGILQSVGYLLLPQRKKLLLIIEQEQNNKEIYQLTGKFGPILGQERTFREGDKQRKTEFQPSIQDLWTILQHLAYMQAISHQAEVRCLAVGKTLSIAKQKKLNEYLANIDSDTNVVFLTNVTVPTQTTNFPITKLIKENAGSAVKTFHTMSQKLKRSSEIIAYAHGDKKGTKGYACIMA